jgi:hypothetical protein
MTAMQTPPVHHISTASSPPMALSVAHPGESYRHAVKEVRTHLNLPSGHHPALEFTEDLSTAIAKTGPKSAAVVTLTPSGPITIATFDDFEEIHAVGFSILSGSSDHIPRVAVRIAGSECTSILDLQQAVESFKQHGVVLLQRPPSPGETSF